MLCVFSILYLVWSIKQEFINRNNKKYHFYIDIGMVALAIYLMLGAEHLFTTSATAFVALCLGAFLYVIFYKNSKSFYNFKPIFIIIIFCIMLYGTITPFIGKLKIFDVTAILNRSETLTDRSIIWEKLTPIVTDNLVLGHGFSYWTDGLTNYLLVNSGHNGYLDTMLTLGIVGLVLSFLFLFASFNKAMSEAKKDMNWSVLWISLILICIIRDISESSLDSFTGMYPIVIFMTLITK
jgi:O-antigen ligase